MLTLTIHKLEAPAKTKKAKPVKEQTLEEACATADLWASDRKRRAIAEVSDWTMSLDGTLTHRTEEKVYVCDDVLWGEGTGQPVLYIGCNCPDEMGHLKELREKLGAEHGKHPCFCKHHTMRQLLAGMRVHIPGIGIVSIEAQVTPTAA